MKELLENMCDVRKFLFNQLVLIKEESEKYPEKLPELSKAMKDIAEALATTRGMG